MIRLLVIIRSNWILFTLTTLVLIAFLSFWPTEELPSVPGTDKIHHLIAYGFLALPTVLRKPNKWMFFCLLFIAYGGAIELLQPYVNRHGGWLDMLANTAGVICGIIVGALVRFLTSEKHNNSA